MSDTRTRARPRGRTLTIVSFVCAAVATLMSPTAIVFGIAGVALGALGWRSGDRLGRVAVVVAVIALVFGLVTGGLLVLVDEIGLIETGWGD